MKRLYLVLAAVLLAGCGGGGGGDATSAMPMPDQVPAPPSPGDTFTSALIALVRSAPESTEPSDVDGTVPALSDGSEPVAVE